MTVSPTKQIFKCFSCGAGGGVFQFLTRYDNLSFPEAVRALAERAHVPLPDQVHAPRHPQGAGKSDLLAINNFAADFYRKQLRAPVGAEALAYAKRRGISDESIERFGLGFAPESWDALLQAARRQRIGENQLVAAGLVVQRQQSSGCYDRFRNRLMFPILDPTGKTIAFGGRAMSDEDPAKYLNSAESILFDKSSNLYGLSWARQSIRTTGQAVVVEGYLDALIPMQAGVENVVATLGTALTDRHVRLLRHHAREAVLIFDADQAGAAAAERALEVFLAQQIHVRVATIPAGKDPCDYCLAQGPQALQKLIDEAPDALQYVWQRRLADYQAAGASLADRRRLVDDFLRLIAASAAYGAIDEVRRGQLAQHIGHLLNIPPGDLQQQMQRLSRPVRRPVQTTPTPAPEGQYSGQPELTTRAERHLLEVLVNRGDLFDHVSEKISPEDFQDAGLRAVAATAWRLGHDDRLNLEDLLACPEMGQLGNLIADLATMGERRGNYEGTLAGAMELMLYHRDQHDLRRIRTGGLDEDALRRLQQRAANGDPRRRPNIR
jgi:DNA primase